MVGIKNEITTCLTTEYPPDQRIISVSKERTRDETFKRDFMGPTVLLDHYTPFFLPSLLFLCDNFLSTKKIVTVGDRDRERERERAGAGGGSRKRDYRHPFSSYPCSFKFYTVTKSLDLLVMLIDSSKFLFFVFGYESRTDFCPKFN